jgi:hypothetical protein
VVSLTILSLKFSLLGKAKRLLENLSHPVKIQSVLPALDVYTGRKKAILQQRKEKKRLTLERRKQCNLYPNNKTPDQCQVANSA